MCCNSRLDENCHKETNHHCDERRTHPGHDVCAIPRRLAPAFILLFLAEGPSHGYELARSFREFMPKGFFADPSVLYRMLKSMEEEELLGCSIEESESGPPKKVYSLTQEGYEALDMWASSFEGLSELLSLFRKRYERLRKDAAGKKTKKKK